MPKVCRIDFVEITVTAEYEIEKGNGLFFLFYNKLNPICSFSGFWDSELNTLCEIPD